MCFSFEDFADAFPYQNEKEIEKLRKIHNIGMRVILIIALLSSVMLYILME